MIIDMDRKGFTIMELIIGITIMAILIVLSFVNLESSQVSSRDAERSVDIETITLHLDSYYRSGTDGNTVMGKYPSVQLTTTIGSIEQHLRDIDPKSFTAPGLPIPSNTSVASDTFIAASNAVQTVGGVLPQPTINQYVYQPIQSDGTLCTLDTQECRKFNIYYRSEADNVIHIVASKNQ